MMPEQRRFIQYLSECQTEEDWLTFVRFALPTLLQDQGVLVAVLVDYAQRDRAYATAAEVSRLLGLLGLRLAAGGEAWGVVKGMAEDSVATLLTPGRSQTVGGGGERGRQGGDEEEGDGLSGILGRPIGM